MRTLDGVGASQVFTGLGDPFQNRAIEELALSIPSADARVLEVGCATGRMLSRLKKADCEVVGVDLHDGNRIQDPNIRYIQADAKDLPLHEDMFDLTLACHVLEHVPDYGQALTELVRVTKPYGKIFLAFPNEPVRGMFAVWSATRLLHNPFRAGELHIHKFDGQERERVSTQMLEMGAETIGMRNLLLPTPQSFMTFNVVKP